MTVEEIKNSTKKLMYKVGKNVAEVIKLEDGTGICIGEICFYYYKDLEKDDIMYKRVLEKIFEEDEN